LKKPRQKVGAKSTGQKEQERVQKRESRTENKEKKEPNRKWRKEKTIKKWKKERTQTESRGNKEPNRKWRKERQHGRNRPVQVTNTVDEYFGWWQEKLTQRTVRGMGLRLEAGWRNEEESKKGG
jgi:hypothetical protein